MKRDGRSPPGDGTTARGPSDVELEITVCLGAAELTVAEVAQLAPGQVIELDRHVADAVDLLVNGQLVARGEIVVEADGPHVVVTGVVE